MRALALAQVAQHRGVDSDLLGDTGRAALQVQPQPQQRIGAGPDTADRATRRGAAAEEGFEHVAEAAEAAEAVAAAPAVSSGSPPRSTMRRFSGSLSTS